MKFRTLLAPTLASILTAVVVAQAQVPGVNSTLQAVFNLVYDASTMKPTYSAAGAVTPAAGATDICSLSGSATKNVRVRRIILTGQISTAANEPVSILKRSTANSGAGTALTKVAYDSTNSLTNSTTNTSTVNKAEVWTGVVTQGTLVGELADIHAFFSTSTTQAQQTIFEFGQRGSPVVLRGIAQQISVSLDGQGGGTGTLLCTFEWTEE